MISMMNAYRMARKRYIDKGKVWYIHKWMNFFNILYGCHISVESKIGEGTILGYGGIGIIIHEKCIIGKNCIISQNVTLGGKDEIPGQKRPSFRYIGNKKIEVPVICNNVKIGAGAVVLGPIVIGSNSIIGANSVVIDDIPPNSIACGIPARVKRSNIVGEKNENI